MSLTKKDREYIRKVVNEAAAKVYWNLSALIPYDGSNVEGHQRVREETEENIREGEEDE